MSPSEVWDALGGQAHTPSLLGKFSGKILVLGSGRCVWDDLQKVSHWDGAVMAVNDIGCHYQKRLHHWVSMYPGFMGGWTHYRKNHFYGGDRPITHSHKDDFHIDAVWRINNWAGGTSGLFACYVALMLGYSQVVLAGMPLTQNGRYFDSPSYASQFADPTEHWVWARDFVFEGKVKSLSGKSEELLGCPE